MSSMTASNQQYYTSYPAVVATGMSSTGMIGHESYVTNQSYQQLHQQPKQQHQHQLQSYQQQQPHHLHHHHHHQQQHQQQHHLHQTHHNHQHPPGHHMQVGPTTHQTRLRTVSAHSNNSTGNAIYGIEDAKSTKHASKQRRDLINAEMNQLKELLPLPASTRQRLSQIQMMALVLVYIRKSNYFCNLYANFGITREQTLNIIGSGFSKALNGFLMMVTQKGKLLYISDNAAEYLGHSMEDLLSQGDKVYDIIEEQDKKIVSTELLMNEEEQSSPVGGQLSSSKTLATSLHQLSATNHKLSSTGHQQEQTNIALCRINVAKNAKRQMRFGDQKVVLIEGHFFGNLPLTSRDEPVFLATCTPVAMPETRECIIQGSTNVFTSIHSMDMKFLYIDSIAEHYLGYTNKQLKGSSWYELVQHEHLLEAQAKHKRLVTSEQERSAILLLRLMSNDCSSQQPVWIHCVMQVKEGSESGGQLLIFCTNQVLSEREAQVMQKNSWLYQFHSLHSSKHCTAPAYSTGSPLIGAGQNGRLEDTQSPNSVCTDYEASDMKSAPISSATSSSQTSGELAPALSQPVSKSPRPASNNKLISGKHSPRSGLESFAAADSYQQANAYPETGSTGSYQQGASAAATAAAVVVAAASSISGSGKLISSSSPNSSASTLSTSPHPGGSSYATTAASAKQPTSYLMQTHSLTAANQQVQPQRPFHQHHTDSLGGSSSASSTSSLLSQNETASTTPNGSSNTVAASLYAAGIDASSIDPLHHMHHHHHHQAQHHPVYGPAAAAGAATAHHQNHHLASLPHHAAAANYASQVMVAHQQRHHPHHHHHSYHPYHHHQHHPVAMHHHGHHQSAHVAPHHHSHHTIPQSAAALYGGSQHPAAAFNAHHHAAAAYHSAAAVAAQVASHPAVHHSQASMHHQNPYQAAAAAAAVHQGVSFHYNKIAAAVNASA